MHFGLTEEQEELSSTVRKLLERRADSTSTRAATESETGFDAELWQTLCEQIGVAAFAIPEEYDGAGFGLFETGIVAEGLGHALAAVPLIGSIVVAEALLASGDDDVCREVLPQVAMGEVAALAWPGVTGPEVSALTVTADGDRLSGTARRVLHGDRAAVLVVAANTVDGPGLFLVDPADAAVTSTPAMDTTLRFADLTFDGTSARRVSGDAAAALHRAHLAGAALVACLQVGGAQRALDMTVAYAKERVQFGRVIGSFQALKHRMADMLVDVETSRSIAWAATYAVATRADDVDVLVASAASHCGDAFMHVAGEAVQLHGGIGITWEHDISWAFKRAQALNQLFGLPHQHRALLPL
ncbi:acyl-CoA dehydrogenase family protein [Nocardioides alcanivorans]|uniref:acyl-CoA dehydrogenase family protein n=1 Tax=Nocardioides alcanivorans TaxID=2897352 RepID=UPI001F176B48|nr:acyl-CoA dehydrogenase family protein [Nocardioides alcanivorans]